MTTDFTDFFNWFPPAPAAPRGPGWYPALPKGVIRLRRVSRCQVSIGSV